jgi:hypothetical protein
MFLIGAKRLLCLSNAVVTVALILFHRDLTHLVAAFRCSMRVLVLKVIHDVRVFRA